MENNFSDYFLVIENCFREKEEDGKLRPPLLNNDGITIGSRNYSRIVMTPLMMDFGYKGVKDQDIHYKEVSRKPIKEQTVDLLNSIKAYTEYKYSVADSKHFPNLAEQDGQKSKRIFEIYPFLGINPQNNYTLKQIQNILNKYFGTFDKSRETLRANMKIFKGDIDSIKENPFIGIKLYPPLDFDPWPNDDKTQGEYNPRPIMEEFYQYCQNKSIPITVHGSESGFVTVTDNNRLKDITSIEKWETVLSESHFPNLKLNIAHFPLTEKNKQRLEKIVGLIMNHKNVYADISCRAFDEKYFQSMQQYFDKKSADDADKLKHKIMFGSDFPVNLPDIKSYTDYIRVFSNSETITDYKDLLCSVNPERFLFGKTS
jgi:predicted TIM-barrel fold metal-dependent hydrolase